MLKYIFIASDDNTKKNGDFQKTVTDTKARVITREGNDQFSFGEVKGNYILPHLPAVDKLNDALRNSSDVENKLNALISDIDNIFPSIGLLSPDSSRDYEIQIHFGGLALEESRDYTKSMIRNMKGRPNGKIFIFRAASRSYSYPRNMWNEDRSFRFPDNTGKSYASCDLPHLKRFYNQIQISLAQGNVFDRFSDRDFWLDTIWDGEHPEYEDAFSKDEQIALLENTETRSFFLKILTPPTGAAPTTPSAATGASTATVAGSTTGTGAATGAGSATVAGATTGTGAATSAGTITVAGATTSTSGTGAATSAGTITVAGATTSTSGTGAATSAGTITVAGATSAAPGAAILDIPDEEVFKIIAQIMRIFKPNPPKKTYVPLRFSRMPYLLSILCALLMVGLLIVMPSIIRVIPRKAEYETVKEEITTKGNPSIINEVIQGKTGNNQTDDKAPQTQKTGDGTQGKTVYQEIPAPIGQSVPVSRVNPFFQPRGRRRPHQMAVQLLQNQQATVVNTEGGKNDDEYRYSMETRMAAPIQYFYLILLFAVYTLAGVLCFIMFLKLLKKHSREQKIQNQEQYFRNLSRLTGGLEQEDEQDIVKQFAQSSLRLYFNGDEGD